MAEYRQVDLELISVLKSKGFRSIQLILQVTNDRERATVEVIPERGTGNALDHIQLDSHEVLEYFGERSPRVRYVINEAMLL